MVVPAATILTTGDSATQPDGEKKEFVDEELFIDDNPIVLAADAVRRMDEALKRESQFSSVGMPAVTAQAMLRDLNRAWVVACMEAGRLVPDLLKLLSKYTGLHDFNLTDAELDLAQTWAGAQRSSYAEISVYFSVSEETVRKRITKIYEKVGVKSRKELFYALKMKDLL